MTRLFVVGGAVMDFVFYVDAFPTGGVKVRANEAAIIGGGCAANAAVAIARLEGQALLSTRLGRDPVGRMIYDDLTKENVDLSSSNLSGARSAYSMILIDASGERQVVNFRGDGLIQSAQHLAAVGEVHGVLADTRWPEGALAAMELAKMRGVPGVLDIEAPAKPNAFDPASHLAFSEQGLDHLYPGLTPEVAIRRVAEDHGGWVCVTLGSRGVAWCTVKREGHVPGFTVDVVDTLGAGDVWHGAFVLRLTEGAFESEAVRFANAAAALKCTRRGGGIGSPTRREVEDFMEKVA